MSNAVDIALICNGVVWGLLTLIGLLRFVVAATDPGYKLGGDDFSAILVILVMDAITGVGLLARYGVLT